MSKVHVSQFEEHLPGEEDYHHLAARPAKWTYFYLCAVLDVYSRKIVGWMVATRRTRRDSPRPPGSTDQKNPRPKSTSGRVQLPRRG